MDEQQQSISSGAPADLVTAPGDAWNMTEIAASLPSRGLPPPQIPFRFHDLPQELQDEIYEQFYDEKYSVVAFMSGKDLVFRGQRYYGKSDENVEDDGLAVARCTMATATDLALVSKRVRSESRAARQAAFNGQMRVTFYEVCSYWLDEPEILPELYLDKWTFLRSRVTSLRLKNLNYGNCQAFSESGWYTTSQKTRTTSWNDLRISFPKLKKIDISWHEYEHQHEWRYDPVDTPEYERISEAVYDAFFVAGALDREFSHEAAHFLGLSSLARIMEGAGLGCKIYLTSTRKWIYRMIQDPEYVRGQVSCYASDHP